MFYAQLQFLQQRVERIKEADETESIEMNGIGNGGEVSHKTDENSNELGSPSKGVDTKEMVTV